MDLGLYVDARPDIAPIARAAEDAGFTHMWVYDSPLVFSDTTVAITRAIDATSRIVIGPGMANPLQRPAPYTAQLAATLAKIAPARVVMGLGTGHSARRSLGLRPARLDELIGHVDAARRLARGETVEHGEGTRIRLLNPRGPWVDVSTRTPWWISAFGPRTRAAAAAVADGLMVRWEGPERAVAVRREVDIAASKAGRDPKEVALGVLTAMMPAENNEVDSDEVVEAIAPLVVSRLRYLHANVESVEEAPTPFQPALAVYRQLRQRLTDPASDVEDFRGYLTSVPDELREAITPEALAAVALVAPAQEIVAELRRMAASGVDHVSMQIAGDPSAFARRFKHRIMSRLAPVSDTAHDKEDVR